MVLYGRLCAELFLGYFLESCWLSGNLMVMTGHCSKPRNSPLFSLSVRVLMNIKVQTCVYTSQSRMGNWSVEVGGSALSWPRGSGFQLQARLDRREKIWLNGTVEGRCLQTTVGYVNSKHRIICNTCKYDKNIQTMIMKNSIYVPVQV